LVDFGATSAVPSWAVTATSFYPDPFVSRFDSIGKSLRSASYFFGRHLDAELGSPSFVDRQVSECRGAFQSYVVLETLKLCGVPEARAKDSLSSKAGLAEASKAVMSVISYFQQDMIDFVDSQLWPTLTWDLGRIWQPNPPTHLKRLARLIRELVPAVHHLNAELVCISRTESRPLLYKPELRRLFNEGHHEQSLNGGKDAWQSIQTFIDQTVSRSLRDISSDEPAEVSLAMAA
jgi:hypothetical protein